MAIWSESGTCPSVSTVVRRERVWNRERVHHPLYFTSEKSGYKFLSFLAEFIDSSV
jgi:hypothetical protein